MNYRKFALHTAAATLLFAVNAPARALEDDSTRTNSAVAEASDSGSKALIASDAAPDATAMPLPLPSPAGPQPPSSPSDEDYDKWKVAIYPILGWAPLFRANTDFNLPNGPSGGISGAGNTNWSINGAALFGVDISKSAWLFEAEGMWASVSANRQNPYVNTSTSASYGDLFVGHKLWKDISFLVGFRRMAVDATVTVDPYPQFSRKPGVWDPLIGLDWRKQFGRKFYAQIRADGGGFGVGSDVDVDLEGRLEWRFAKHFGLLIGYEGLHYQISGDKKETIGPITLSHPWQLRQTFNGPLMGFGIYF